MPCSYQLGLQVKESKVTKSPNLLSFPVGGRSGLLKPCRPRPCLRRHWVFFFGLWLGESHDCSFHFVDSPKCNKPMPMSVASLAIMYSSLHPFSHDRSPRLKRRVEEAWQRPLLQLRSLRLPLRLLRHPLQLPPLESQGREW